MLECPTKDDIFEALKHFSLYGIDVQEDGEESLINVVQKRLFAKVFQSG